MPKIKSQGFLMFQAMFKRKKPSVSTENFQPEAVVHHRLKQHADNMNFLISFKVPLPLIVLIFEYANYYNILRYDLFVSPVLATSFGLFKLTSDKRYLAECKQAEVLVNSHILTAGPLDKLEIEVRKNPNVLLKPIQITMTLDGIDFTLVGSPLQLAIMLLDQNYETSEYLESSINEGQAEKMMALIKELVPESIFEAEEQARFAAPEEDEKERTVKDAERLNILKDAFGYIKTNNFNAARKTIREYIIKTKPPVITDNQYFLSLLKLIHEAYNLLFSVTRAPKAKDGTRLSQDSRGRSYETRDMQFCTYIIGTIQRVLPSKLRKILISHYKAFHENKLDRTLDVSDSSYLVFNRLELGVNGYFDSNGIHHIEGRCYGHGVLLPNTMYSTICHQLHQAQQNLCYAGGDRTLNDEAIRKEKPARLTP